MSAGGWSKARLGRMHETLSRHVERGDPPGLVALVSRRGEVHVEVLGLREVEGREPMRRDTIFRIASMTKPITAAATMILVEECRLRLDDPVDDFLPELAERKVLRRLEGPLDDTVPAHRPISVRDLLTFRMGFGLVLAPPGLHPIQKAIAEAGLVPGPQGPSAPPEEWMKRLGALPLLHQPGEHWMYHTGSDVLGVLIARASGQTLETFLRERLFEPLGMKDTGFHVPADKLDRLVASYSLDSKTGTLSRFDAPDSTRWSRPPVFASGGGGLVSTADDCLAFQQMLLNKGRHGRERVLSRPSIELMTSDQVPPEHRAGAGLFFGPGRSWGFGGAVELRREHLSSGPGRYGWDGGYGTSGYMDPREELIGILLTQRLMTSPRPPPVFLDFWTSAYQAIDD